MTYKKKTFLNIVTSVLSLVIPTCIGFFLAPYIVRMLGVEAQGFVQMAANFASYIAVITVALNSMSGRFISISIAKGEIENAGKYYTSVLFSNVFIVLIVLIPFMLFVAYIERLIKIPTGLVKDVKILFLLTFFTFFMGELLSQFNNVFYVKDKIYLQTIGNLINTLIYSLLTIILFTILQPQIWYMSIATLVALSFSSGWGLYHKMKMLPSLKVKKSLFSISHVKEIISSGIWRTILSAGLMLTDGLDLLICNLFISPTAMGNMALAKILPSSVSQLNFVLVNTFAPNITSRYAVGDYDGIKVEIKLASKINSIICTIPLMGVMLFGNDFFTLWMPKQNPRQLHLIAILACIGIAITVGVQPVGNVFVTVNKVKFQAVSTIISGVINIAVVFLMLNFTDLGIYAIAGVSCVIAIVRNIVYTIPVAAKCLGFKWHTFFYGFIYSIIGLTVTFVAGISIKFIFVQNSWIMLILSAFITGMVALFLNTLIIFNKAELITLKTAIFSKLKIQR